MPEPIKLDLRSELQKLRDMEMHASFYMDDISILRVLGGWIYSTYTSLDANVSSVFVKDTGETEQ